MINSTLINKKMIDFKKTFSFNDRHDDACRVLTKYPDRIPIICEKNATNNDIAQIDKIKYLVPMDMTCGQFMFTIRKRLKLPPEKAIFILVNGVIPPVSESMYNIYNAHKSPDKFLYITYVSENVFG
jgi:GABA(A) receptor-associated protein